MSRLALYLLGPPRIERDGVPVKLGRRKAIALVAFLAVSGESQRRDSLVNLLWPEYDTARGRSAFRRTLYALKKALPGEWLDVDRAEIGLVSGDGESAGAGETLWVDVVQFRCHLSECESHGHAPAQVCPACVTPLTAAVALVRGDFMGGFGLRDSLNFDDWLIFQAQTVRRELDDALQRLVRWHSTQREFETAIGYARRKLGLDPLDEGAHRQLMRLYAWSGRRSAALGQHEACEAILEDQLDVRPQEETTALFRSIREGGTPALPAFEGVVHEDRDGPGDAGRATAASAERPDRSAEFPPFMEGTFFEGEVAVEQPLFVAREPELASLDQHLQAALSGQGRIVFVTGDAGSGKTALLQEFARSAQDAHDRLIIAGGQGNAQTGIGDPYLPFREVLGLLTGDVEAEWAAGAMTREQVRRLWHTLPYAARALAEHGPDLVDTFVQRAALVRRAREYAPGRVAWLSRLEEGAEVRPDTGPGVTGPLQSDLFEQYTRVLQTLTQRGPLLLIVDDLQWADLGTISLLFHLGRELVGFRVLIAGAYRPEEIALGRECKRHPLEPVVHELQRAFGDIVVDLGRAERRGFVDAYLESEPNRLGEAFGEMLYRQTHGHPLFTIELLRGLQEQGDLVRDPEGIWVESAALDWDTLPARVEAVIAERIGRLSEPLRAALRVASVEGEAFTAEVIARVQGISDVELVGHLSRELDKRHRLVRVQGIQRMDGQRLSQYRFRHILFQRYLYSSLDEVERAYLHEAVGDTLEAIYEGQTEAVAAVAGQLAWHFQEAGLAAKAVRYLHEAGARAERLCAYEEAIAHLTRGLELLQALPDPGDEEVRQERAEAELAMQVSLGKAWIGHSGFGTAAGAAFTRARELSQQAGSTAQLSHVVGELSVFQFVASEPRRAFDLATEALSQAEHVGDPLLVALSNWYLGLSHFAMGDYTAACARHERMISFYKPEAHHQVLLDLRGSDAGTCAMSYKACSLWCLGYPDQALELSQKAIALARRQGHAFSLADVLCFAGCLLHRMRGDGQVVKEYAAEMRRMSRHSSIPGWLAASTYHGGEALAMLGQPQQAIALMREGLEGNQAIGVRVFTTGVLCTMAAAQAELSRPKEGLATIDEALTIVQETGERHFESDVHRTRGEILLRLGDAQAAEGSFHGAIEVAQKQRAKSWELRATMSLARLWRSQGKVTEAWRRLDEVYGWFTEGFDTADLVEARGLLEELAGEPVAEVE